MVLRHVAVLAVVLAVAWAQGRPGGQGGGQGGGRELIRPDPRACRNRVTHAATFRNGHYYFFSWAHGPTSQHERDWLDARNICRYVWSLLPCCAVHRNLADTPCPLLPGCHTVHGNLADTPRPLPTKLHIIGHSAGKPRPLSQTRAAGTG